MKKETKNKIKLLKEIRPDEDWKSDLRNELFVEKSYLFNPIEFENIFASLALVGLLLFVVFVNTLSLYIQEVEDTRSDHLETQIVEPLEAEVADDNNKEFLDYFTKEVDIYELDEEDKLNLAKEGTRVLIEEIGEVEERISQMITMMD